MPDISKCMNSECERCEQCYRFVSLPSKQWQSYFNPLKTDGTCDYFYPLFEGLPTEENEPVNKPIRIEL